MKKLLSLFVILLAAALILGFAGCSDDGGDNNNPPPPPPGGGETTVDFTNTLSNYSVKVSNNTDKRLVAFKGQPNVSSLIGGIPGSAGNHGLPKPAGMFTQNEPFILFIVTEEDYEANKSNLTSLANIPFTRIYAFFSANSTSEIIYSISSKLGGNAKIMLNNNTGFNVELRLDGVTDEVSGGILGYAAAGMFNTELKVDEGNYMVFPVFRKFNQARGEIFTFIPRYQGGAGDGKAKFTTFSLASGQTYTIDAQDFMGQDVVLKTGAAYLMIQNNHSSAGMEIHKGGNPLLTSTGFRYVNRTENMTFQIDMPKNPAATQNDDYLDELTLQGFSVGTPAYKVPLDSYTFESDKIYQVIITGNDPYDVNLGEITVIGTVDWNQM